MSHNWVVKKALVHLHLLSHKWQVNFMRRQAEAPAIIRPHRTTILGLYAIASAFERGGCRALEWRTRRKTHPDGLLAVKIY